MMSQTYPGTKKQKTTAKRRTYARSPGNITNKNVTGYVRQFNTDLSLNRSPFTPKKFMNFIYENELTPLTGGTNVVVRSVVCNDLYDFDRNGDLGNKQPLYFDTLLTASGPYRNFKVISWVTTWTIYNHSTTIPVTCWAVSPTPLSSDIDSAAEADNFPGVKRLYLTAQGGSKSMGTVTQRGHIGDVFPNILDDINLQGNYTSSPISQAFGGLVIKGSDGATAPSVYVAVKHVAYTMLSGIDALVS